MARTRQERRNDFDEFYNSAKDTFISFRDEDTRAEKFERIYMLSVCPGSRAGGNNNRIVEVFWGSRPFETITQGNSWKSLTEYGATLLFERDDSGYVIISIYPAGTDNKKPIESSISLKIWIDPIKLKDKSFLKSRWNDFMAYMEYTSLDGNPTIWQRLKISYLRNFKHLVVDKKWQPTKFSEFSKDVLKWILTVGLSGVIIYFVTLFTQPKTTETEIQLKEVNVNLESVSKELDEISNSSSELNTISISLDSIENKTKHILKTLSNKKAERTTKAIPNKGSSGKLKDSASNEN
jgi:hypothetical protein